MILYLLTNARGSALIRAKSEARARHLAGLKFNDVEAWASPLFTFAENLLQRGGERIIIYDITKDKI